MGVVEVGIEVKLGFEGVILGSFVCVELICGFEKMRIIPKM